MLIRFWGSRGSIPAPLGYRAIRSKLHDALIAARGHQLDSPEAIDKSALPKSLKAHNATLLSLGAVYKQINSPFGQVAMDSLKVSTFALSSTDANTYLTLEQEIQGWTTTRDAIAGQMKAMLQGAAFGGQALDEKQAKSLISQAQTLSSQVSSAASSL